MTAEQILAQVQDLPPVSEAALKLLKLLGRHDHDSSDVVKAVRYDAILTAKLLRACNSALQGLREPIASVEQAVLQLGHQEILRLVLALNVSGTLDRPLGGYAVGDHELWQHALITALGAEQLVEHGLRAHFEQSVAFTAGLLHDLGKVVLHHALTPEIQAAVRARIKEGGCSRPEAERAVVGTDHAEVGAVLLARWELPDAVVEAVAHHHQPPAGSPPPLSCVIHLANWIAHTTGSTPGWEGYAVRFDESTIDRLGLEASELEQVMIGVHLSLHQIRQFLTLP